MSLVELKALKETYATVKAEAKAQREQCVNIQKEIDEKVEIAIPKIEEKLHELADLASELYQDSPFQMMAQTSNGDRYSYWISKKESTLTYYNAYYGNEKLYIQNKLTGPKKFIEILVCNWGSVERQFTESIKHAYENNIKAASDEHLNTLCQLTNTHMQIMDTLQKWSN